MRSALIVVLGLIAPARAAVPGNRVASVYLSQTFLNEELAQHAKSDLIKELRVELDATSGKIFLRGVLQVPVEELRAVNLEPKFGSFRFQLTIHPETTRQGHLILEFPLDETFFYPADSRDPAHDRVIVPVQMLSLALASARGYLAALSGDFSGFDRRTKKLEALIKGLDAAIAAEKNADASDDLKNQRDAIRLQLEAVPIERKQLQAVAKEVSGALGFTGEKELNLNEELGARKNALILKIKLSQFAPYLSGVELSGVRVLHDKRDGGGQNYLAVDANAQLAVANPPPSVSTPSARAGMAVAPSLIVRLNQSLFESAAVLAAEKKDMGSKIRSFNVDLREDGLHVSGEWKSPLLLSVPFETVVDFVSTGPDVFEMRVRELKVADIELEALSGFVLEALKKRFDASLKGVCTFQYVGEEKDRSRALRVAVDPKALIPAFPGLHLVDVDVKEREFLLKLGRL
jgi:hypothetical protein